MIRRSLSLLGLTLSNWVEFSGGLETGGRGQGGMGSTLQQTIMARDKFLEGNQERVSRARTNLRGMHNIFKAKGF